MKPFTSVRGFFIPTGKTVAFAWDDPNCVWLVLLWVLKPNIFSQVITVPGWKSGGKKKNKKNIKINLYITKIVLYLYRTIKQSEIMKLNKFSIINVVESTGYVKHHVDYMNLVKSQDIKNLTTYEEKISFFKETKWRRLILSDKTKNNLSNYMVPKNIRYDVLRSLPNRTDSIMIDKLTLLRYIKTDECILGMFDTDDVTTNNLYNYYFRFDLVNEKLTISVGDHRKMDASDHDLDESFKLFIEKFFSKFMVVVTYLELTPITLDVIDGGRSFGTKRDNKIKNETNKRFILVNTNWNVEKLDLRDVHVRGHWRLQPCGVGRSQFKYIFIKPYEKGITRRLPQKELV